MVAEQTVFPKTERILFIDDDMAFGLLLKRNLTRMGFTVFGAPDADAGIRLLREGGIDVIALDHYLQGETGLDVLPRIMGEKDHPPVVYMTGSVDDAIVSRAMHLGAQGYVSKSLSADFFDRLSVALQGAVERAQSAGRPAG